MLARFDSKLPQRGKLQRTHTGRNFAWSWIGLAIVLLVLWLSFHYILHPAWLNQLPSFFTELLVLIEAASIITLCFVAFLFWYRRHKQKKHLANLSIDQLYSLSPADFERYVAGLFRKKGYQVKLRGQKGDRGVDLELFQPGGRKAIVQCKRYRHRVGPDIVRELFGTMIHERVHHAFLVTTADISQAAREWATFKPMTLIDGTTLVKIATNLDDRSRE